MAYDPNKPADADFVRKSAEYIRENFEGLRQDGIVIAKPPLYGYGAPSLALGESGDRYIDTATGNHYYKNVSGQWKLNLSLDDKYKTSKDIEAVIEKLQAMNAAIETTITTLKASGTVYNSERLNSHDEAYYRCANGCSWTCSSGCSGGCDTTCTGTCAFSCTSCTGCTGTCSGGCSSCTGGCSTTCSGTCTFGCTGCSSCSGPN